jgi:hypothetical protein
MSSHDDLECHYQRARKERELARAASDKWSAELHSTLAVQYEALVAKAERSARVRERWANAAGVLADPKARKNEK